MHPSHDIPEDGTTEMVRLQLEAYRVADVDLRHQLDAERRTTAGLRRRLRLWRVAAAVVACVAILVVAIGCLPSRTETMPDATSVITETADKITAATEHNRVIARKIEDAPGSPVVEVKPVVQMQAKALTEAKAASADAAKEYAAREKTLAEERDGWKTKYEALRGDPFVRAALWVKWALIAITVAWAVAGVAGMLLTGLAPAGIWFNLGRHLLALLPFANLFSFGSRVIERKWGVAP